MNAILLMSLPAGAYLAGSIPFGLIIVKVLAQKDIRRLGSGNIGATNVKRILGTPYAVATLICDALKGALPVTAALYLQDTTTCQWIPAATALFAIIGHMHPIYFAFKPSGKGVATTLGCFLVISPLAFLLIILFFVLVVYFSRRVSLGSLAAAITLPPAIWFTTHAPVICATAIIIMIFILLRHSDNLQRIARGTEPTI